MWNRLLISLLLLLGSQALFSQTWLNKTDKDILLYISENKERIEAPACRRNQERA